MKVRDSVANRERVLKLDFSRIRAISVDGMLDDPASKPVLVSRFDADPGPAPLGTVPIEPQTREMPYIAQLLEANRREKLASPRWSQSVAQSHARCKVHRRNRGCQIASSGRCRLTSSVTKIRR
jgi:hypothetical protein